MKIRGRYSIQVKIMAVSLLTALGTTIASLLISYYAEIDTIKTTTEEYMEQYIAFTDDSFNKILDETQKILISISLAQDVVVPNLADPGTEASYGSFRKKMQLRAYLSSFLSQKEYIHDVILVSPQNEIYRGGKEFIAERELSQPVMRQAMAKTGTGLTYDPDTRSLLVSRAIYYRKGQEQIRTTAIVLLDYDQITSLYQVEPLEETAIFLYLPDRQLLYTNMINGGEGPRQMLDERTGTSGYVVWNGQRQYYIRYDSATNGMTMIGLIPENVLLHRARDLRLRFILIGVAACAFAVALSAYLAKKISANIRKLASGMEAIRKGDLGVRMEIATGDEIEDLARTFNMTMDQIESLMEEIKERERKKTELEQEILATQIEPHFLYNSIDSIQYVSHMQHQEEIEKVAASLSELLRSVLSNHNEFITLWEEKDYIENYIAIERFKYRSDFTVTWEVEEELWEYPIPKLLLQPIVENALLHGIAEKGDDGRIHIKVCIQEQEVVVKVIDNGRGMDADTVAHLLEKTGRTDKSGFRRIGLANVFSRIRLLYGEAYGGRIDSLEGVFTCVELHLPLDNMK